MLARMKHSFVTEFRVCFYMRVLSVADFKITYNVRVTQQGVEVATEGFEFNSWSGHCYIAAVGKSFTPLCHSIIWHRCKNGRLLKRCGLNEKWNVFVISAASK